MILNVFALFFSNFFLSYSYMVHFSCLLLRTQIKVWIVLFNQFRQNEWSDGIFLFLFFIVDCDHVRLQFVLFLFTRHFICIYKASLNELIVNAYLCLIFYFLMTFVYLHQNDLSILHVEKSNNFHFALGDYVFFFFFFSRYGEGDNQSESTGIMLNKQVGQDNIVRITRIAMVWSSKNNSAICFIRCDVFLMLY